MRRQVLLCISLPLCFLVLCTFKEQQPKEPREDKNHLHHVEHLYPLFDKLIALEKDSNQKINILHIGDSHVQGNYFTDKIRNLFYSDFGLGSKGLAFPFQLAKTNTMAEIRTYSKQVWETRKITQSVFSNQMGISGRVIVNTTSNTSFTIRIPDCYSNYFFNQITLLVSPINKNINLQVEDSLRTKMEKTKEVVQKDYHAITFSSKYLNKMATIHYQGTGNYLLHGFLLENTKQGGITYHVAGVNGSQYRHWAAPSLIEKQSSQLKPDLIIISLGTNDANDDHLSTDDFTKYINQLVSALRRANPNACFILTTPADSYYKGRYVNKQVDRIRQSILLYAEENKISCWDLYEIMGGENSIISWYKQGLAAKDLVHFTKAGYELQGELFYESFIKHYTSYASH